MFRKIVVHDCLYNGVRVVCVVNMRSIGGSEGTQSISLFEAKKFRFARYTTEWQSKVNYVPNWVQREHRGFSRKFLRVTTRNVI